MASTYGEGKTFLDTLKRSFTDVPVNKERDNAIATTEFLEAAESLTTLFGKWTCVHALNFGNLSEVFWGSKWGSKSQGFWKEEKGREIMADRASYLKVHPWRCLDVLGSVAFTPVKSDMLGNVKVSAPYLPRPSFQCGKIDGALTTV